MDNLLLATCHLHGGTNPWSVTRTATKSSRVVHARQGGVTPWSVCVGIAGQFGVEWLVSLRRNQWSICSGIRSHRHQRPHIRRLWRNSSGSGKQGIFRRQGVLVAGYRLRGRRDGSPFDSEVGGRKVESHVGTLEEIPCPLRGS